jgi:hypothetical protein
MPGQQIDPEIVAWFQLRTQPESSDPADGSIQRGLKAEIRDPLWMLSRQWQFGEFKAEDTGSAIHVSASLKMRKFNKLSLSNDASPVDFTDDIPLEAIVECEDFLNTFRVKIEMGIQWMKLLKSAGKFSLNEVFYNSSLPVSLKINLPADEADNYNKFINNKYKNYLNLAIKNHVIDGGAFYKYLFENSQHKASEFLNSADPVIDDLGSRFVKMYKSIYTLPLAGSSNAWDNQRLEYKFNCRSEIGTDKINLIADEYYDGKLDWNDFNIVKEPASGVLNKNTLIQNTLLNVLPVGVKFPGMPLKRWWEIENYNTSISNLDIGKYDVASLVFSEFCLRYSGNWLLIPCKIRKGCYSEISNLLVKDVFGKITEIKHTKDIDPNNSDWSLFSLTNDSDSKSFDKGLYFPFVVNTSLHSDPVEEINFLRDDMADLVWGIETIIQDTIGIGHKAHEAAQKYLKEISNIESVDSNADDKEKVYYNLMRGVAPNWIPFIMKNDNTGTNHSMLQRAAIPLSFRDNKLKTTKPATDILKEYPPGLIYSEEIPGSGAVVSKKWNRIRWVNGKVVTWLGLTKKSSRGEIISNLKFDFLE